MKILKYLILLFCCFFFCSNLQAQKTLGVGVSYYDGIGAPGLQVRLGLPTKKMREVGIIYELYFPINDDKLFMVGVDLNFKRQVATNSNFYFKLGLNLIGIESSQAIFPPVFQQIQTEDVSKGLFGGNLGFGFEQNIKKHFKLILEGKILGTFDQPKYAVFHKTSHFFAHITFGVAYRF